MTPNRKLRTTAIAAMVAVSTVFAGVTPAIAAPAASVLHHPDASYTQPAGLNVFDGSKLPEGQVKDEDQLKEATDSVAKKLEEFGNSEDTAAMAAYFADFESNPELAKANLLGAVTQNEAGALEALTARLNQVSATLKTAAQNQADAQATVTDFLNKDIAAHNAFKALVDYLNSVDEKALNALIADVNAKDYVAPGKTKTSLDPIPEVKKPVTNEEASDIVHAIVKHRENLRDLKADKSADEYVDRYYSKALEKLLNSELVKGFLDPYEAAQPILFAYQNTDIIPAQVFMDRARAQVLVLRIIEAKYAVAVRMLELYENDLLGDNASQGLQTVKEAYYEAVTLSNDSITAAEAREREQLAAADKAAEDFFKGYTEDQSNDWNIEDDAEYKAFVARRKADADRAYKNIVADRVWQTLLEKAQLKDRKYFAEGDAAKKAEQAKFDAEKAKTAEAQAKADAQAKAAAEAAKAAAEAKEKAAQLQRELDAAKAEIDKHKNQPAPQPTDEPKPTNEPAAPDFPIVPIAIVGVVLAALAALAAHFPVIAGMLPKI